MSCKKGETKNNWQLNDSVLTEEIGHRIDSEQKRHRTDGQYLPTQPIQHNLPKHYSTEKKPVNCMNTVIKQLDHKQAVYKQRKAQALQIIQNRKSFNNQLDTHICHHSCHNNNNNNNNNNAQKQFLKGNSCMREIYELKQVQGLLAEKYLRYKEKAKKYRKMMQDMQIERGIEQGKEKKYEECLNEKQSLLDKLQEQQLNIDDLQQQLHQQTQQLTLTQQQLVIQQQDQQKQIDTILQKEYQKLDIQVQEIEQKQRDLVKEFNQQGDELKGEKKQRIELESKLREWESRYEVWQKIERGLRKQLGDSSRWEGKYKALQAQQQHQEYTMRNQNIAMEQQLAALQQQVQDNRSSHHNTQHSIQPQIHTQLSQSYNNQQCKKTHLDLVYNDLIGEIKQMKTEIDFIETNQSR